MYQYSSFRMYQYSSFHTYVDCHVTKSKVQAEAVTVFLPKHMLVSSTSNNQNNGRLLIAKNMIYVLKTLLVLRPGGWTVEELGLVSGLWLEFLAIVVHSLEDHIYQGFLYDIS
jgi:hypothetical protein